MRCRRWFEALVVVVLAFAPATAARANTYTVWSCTDGNGAPASTQGWTPWTSADGTATTSNTCPAVAGGKSAAPRATVGIPKGLTATLTGSTASDPMETGQKARWSYAAPANTSVNRVTVTRSGVARVVPSSYSFLDGRATVYTGGDVCQAGPYGGSDCSFGGASDVYAPYETVGVACLSGSASSAEMCPNHSGVLATLYVTRAVATLQDSEVPAVGAVSLSGSAPAGAAQSGVVSVSFPAVDQGGGILSARVTVDGATAWTSTADAFDECSPAMQATGFHYPVPCPLSTTVTGTIDTTKFSKGSHVVAAYVTDVGQNESPAAKKTLLVDNTPATSGGSSDTGSSADPSGTGGSAGTGGTAATGGSGGTGSTSGPAGLTTQTTVPVVGTAPGVTAGGAGPIVVPKGADSVIATYGEPLQLRGTLKDGRRRVVPNAKVVVAETASGASPTTVATITTDARGRYQYTAGTLTGPRLFSFTPAVDGASLPVRFVSVKIGARVTLGVDRTSAKRGAPVTFSGTVAAGTLPSDGVRVVIEASDGHRWLLAGTPRTDATGRFTWSHRFRTAINYRFRARLLATSQIAVGPGVSKTVRVAIR